MLLILHLCLLFLLLPALNSFILIGVEGSFSVLKWQPPRRTQVHSSFTRRCPSTCLSAMPKAIIFDLDGCLWRPEMYELIWFSNGKGAPFRPDPKNPSDLLTVGNEPVYLLGDVRDVLSEIYNREDYKEIKIGISSRTDEPDWARELLSKFMIKSEKSETDGKMIAIEEVFNGPIEIAKDSKVKHFKRISEQCNIAMEDILFFDNEIGNCRQVADLGVTVAYCPDGVTNNIWKRVLTEEFPSTNGVVEVY